MREILFRGKRLDDGQWVCGGYAKKAVNNRVAIIQQHANSFYGIIAVEVDPKTVGQSIGRKDKNGHNCRLD